MKCRPALVALALAARRAGRRTLAGVLAAGLVAGLLWWAWPDGERLGLPSTAGAALPPRSDAGSAAAPRLPATPLAVAGLAVGAAGAVADGLADGAAVARPAQPTALARCQTQAAAARRAPPGATADAAEVAEADPALAALQPAEPDAALLAAVWDRTARQLQGSPQPRQQAAALLMKRPGLAKAAPDASLPAAALASLVTLALTSADPTVLQWAAGACATAGAHAACQGLSARAWVQAEPDNLLAWLPLLAQDPQAKEEALQGMAQARRADGGWMRWAAVANAAKPADLPPALRYGFGWRLTELTTTQSIPAWQPLMVACKDDALADPRRRGQCGQIARLMVDQGRELVTVLLGYAVGKRLGWSAEQAQAHQAFKSASRRSTLDFWQPGLTLDCQAELLEHWMAQVDQLGEAELARVWLRTAAAAASAAHSPR